MKVDQYIQMSRIGHLMIYGYGLRTILIIGLILDAYLDKIDVWKGDDMNTLSLNDEQIEQIVLALTIAAQNMFTCGIEHPNSKTADELIKKSEKFDAVLDVIIKQADLPIKFARNQVD